MGRRGFTLLELLVVIAIMATIMGSTMTAFFSIGQGARMRGAVNTLQSSLALARQRTILQQVPLSVVFSNDTASATWHYQIEEAESRQLAGEETASKHRIGEVMHVPPGVELDFSTSPSITFRPSGDAAEESFIIRLKDPSSSDQEWVLTVYGLTGLVKVVSPGDA